DAVAELRQRQPLEDEVAEPAIGRRGARPLHRLNEAVGGLRLAAAVEPDRQPGRIEDLPVCPEATEVRDLALAESNGEARRDGALVVVRSAEAFRSSRFVGQFLEFGRPDDVPAEPRPAIEPGNGDALA